ncbi:putative PurR-regulated permease PerM [Flavobacterium croceum DSM 17960]|uniref:Putative PurR-regulated permease PerM n=1 Tax=Flavobacterium croceum DSM 17960 TaxID=1121886 RepID=A0A2S4N7E3_9FLAO|nr:AI-2E family transporter [Flavobacterium croceum]POS01626.1 putative PurR-regulated permease PerM [Flavobacterium croceum DSM 17960]
MITSKIIANGLLRAIGILVLISIGCYFIYTIQTVLYYIIIAFLTTLIANPVVEFFRKKLKFSNTIAITTTLILFILLMIGMLLLFVPLITSQSSNMSFLDSKNFQKSIQELYHQLDTTFKHYNINIDRIVSKSNVSSKINFSVVTDFINELINVLSSFGAGFASVLFIMFFMLKDKVYFIAIFKKLMPDDHEDKILASIEKTNTLLSRYFIGLLLQTLIIFVMYLIVLLIFGVENAFIIALISALLNIIPYLGPLISTALTTVLILLSGLGSNFQSEAIPTAIYVFIGFTIVQIIDNNVSNTVISSKSVNMHPLEVFIITIIGGLLMGIVGMIIAVPLLTVIKVVLKEFFPENQFIQLFTKGI